MHSPSSSYIRSGLKDYKDKYCTYCIFVIYATYILVLYFSVVFMVLHMSLKKHLVQTFKPNAQSSSLQKPKTDINVASGCPEFADLLILDNTSYVKDDVDVVYIKDIMRTS